MVKAKFGFYTSLWIRLVISILENLNLWDLIWYNNSGVFDVKIDESVFEEKSISKMLYLCS